METLLGNSDLLQWRKTAFLCSRTVKSSAVMRCYDWATEQQSRGICVMSGFNSPMEKDVLHFLLRSKVPVVMVLARRMYKTLPADLQTALDEGRLLVVSLSTATRQSQQTVQQRNQYLLRHADSFVFGSLSSSSSLYPLFEAAQSASLPCQLLCNYD